MYLQIDLPKHKFTLLLLDFIFVYIIYDINPEYKQHVRTKEGISKLYLRVLKFIYGVIIYALLWYELYVSVLTDMGFQINPYDICVVNKDINGKQCNISWHVEDNNVSHME